MRSLNGPLIFLALVAVVSAAAAHQRVGQLEARVEALEAAAEAPAGPAPALDFPAGPRVR